MVDNDKEILYDLVKILDMHEGKTVHVSNQGQSMDGYTALANFVEITKRAKEHIRSKEWQNLTSTNI